MKSMLTFATLALMATAQVSTAERVYPENNEVDLNQSCQFDNQCDFMELQYIKGLGQPVSNYDVCCATFPYFDYGD